MRNSLYIACLLLLSPVFCWAQDKDESKAANEFVKRFNLKMDTVQWLCEYDNIAWWTSDSVMASPKEDQARLGSEWFCFKTGDQWHALYGKYSEGRYETVFHYIVNSKSDIRRVKDPVDSSMTQSMSRALKKGLNEVYQFPDTVKVRFNQYIRQDPDGNFTVWFLPAFTQKGIAVWGGEFIYRIDKTGNHILSRHEYSQGYKGAKPGEKTELWLDYTRLDEPSLGAVFFVWYYRTYFGKITVDAKKIKSTVMFSNDEFTWVHAMKEE